VASSLHNCDNQVVCVCVCVCNGSCDRGILCESLWGIKRCGCSGGQPLLATHTNFSCARMCVCVCVSAGLCVDSKTFLQL
jgi:hypothetical protein